MFTKAVTRQLSVFVMGLAALVLWLTYFSTEAQVLKSININIDQNQFLAIADGGNASVLDLSNELTLETWVKFKSIQSADDDIFIAKRRQDGNRSYTFHSAPIGSGTENLTFVWWSNGVNEGGNVQVEWNPTVETWYHVAVTKIGTSVKFYVNGEQQGATQFGSNATIYDGEADFRIGADSDDAADDFDGKFDDVRVWNIARTQAEIATAKSLELSGTESGLVANWKFNGDSLEDSTVNNNHLTNVNGAAFSEDVPFFDEPELSPEEQAENLIKDVLAYELPKKLENALHANLKKVAGFIMDGKIDAAKAQLQVFMEKVEAYYVGGDIPTESRNQLMGAAEAIVVALE